MPLIAVRAEPSMVPVPLAVAMAAISAAAAAPAERRVLKGVGSVSRSVRA